MFFDIRLSVLCGALCVALQAVFCTHSLAHAGHDVQLQRLDKSIAVKPASQRLHIERAALYTQAHRFADAEADFKRSDALGPAVAADYHRALFYEARSQFDDARRSLNRYLGSRPSATYAYEARARIAQALGEDSAAVADLRRYLALSKQPNPGNYIATANLLSKQGDYAAALNLLDEGLKRLGIIPSLQHEAIAIEKRYQNLPAAIARLETLREPLRANAQWKLQMATLLLQICETTKANNLLTTLRADIAAKRVTPARKRILLEAQELQKKLCDDHPQHC